MRVEKRNRLILLAAGVSLWLLYFLYLPRNPPPVYSFIGAGMIFVMLGLGTTSIIYSIKGRVACKWASILFAILTVIAHLITGAIPPEIPSGFPVGLITIITYPALPFTLALWFIRKGIKWKLPLVTIAVLLLSSYQSILFTTSLNIKGDTSDTPLRDEVNVKNGWTLCGELYLDSTKPGYHVVTWSKKFRGNESFACYLKIKVPEGSRPVFATFSLHVSLQRLNIPAGGDVVPFYHSTDLKFNLRETLEQTPKPYKFYEGPNTIGGDTLSGSLKENTVVIERVDVYFSYMPTPLIPGKPLPEYYSTEVVTEVNVKFEVNILWEV